MKSEFIKSGLTFLLYLSAVANICEGEHKVYTGKVNFYKAKTLYQNINY